MRFLSVCPYNKVWINEALGSVKCRFLVVVLYSEYLKTSNLVISPRKWCYDQLGSVGKISGFGVMIAPTI